MTDTLLPPELVALATRVVEENRAAGLRIAVAESCTGGLVTAALTEVPGASEVVEAGFVTYSDEAKTALLGVSSDVIQTFGAVSLATAWAMANGAAARANANVAVAITGIAGPGGGTEQKPVGTVVFARARVGEDPDRALTDQRHFDNKGRSAIRLQAALCALELLLPEAGAP